MEKPPQTFETASFSSFIISGCMAQNVQSVYYKGVTNTFEVYKKEKEEEDFMLEDTLSFEIKGKGIIGSALGLNIVEWTSHKNVSYFEKRGINISEGRVELQTPIQLEYLQNEYAAIAPYPAYSITMKQNYTSESEHKFPKGYGKLKGKTIHQFSKVLDESAQLDWKGNVIECKFSEGYNTSGEDEFGKYIMQSYYNVEYGFMLIRFIYPAGRIVELRRI